MNFTNCLFFLAFIAFTNGEKLIDPWHHVRETCRKREGLTREQLAKSVNHLSSAKNYYTCLAMELGHMREDGTIDTELEKKNLQLLTPLVIAKPVTHCCNERVYKGKAPPKDKIADYFIEYIKCFKSMVSTEMFNAMGGLAAPVYPPLKPCHKDDKNSCSH